MSNERRLLDYGPRAVLVECPDTTDAASLAAALRADSWPGVVEVVPGARTVLVRLDDELDDTLRSGLLSRSAPATATFGETVQIAVRYDGPDLAEVAERLGITSDEVVSRHTGQQWRVGFCGFAPGFAYLYGERDDLRVPRRSEPRTRVPAGAVGLADTWSGIYPRPGPGGWQLIGSTSESLWQLDRDPPARLRPGMGVRFVRDGS